MAWVPFNGNTIEEVLEIVPVPVILVSQVVIKAFGFETPLPKLVCKLFTKSQQVLISVGVSPDPTDAYAILFCDPENNALFKLAAFKYNSDEDAVTGVAVTIVGTLFFHKVQFEDPVLDTVISPIGPPVISSDATALAAPATVVGDENNESEFVFRLYANGV